jgi:hypothetical protein
MAIDFLLISCKFSALPLKIFFIRIIVVEHTKKKQENGN